MIVVPTGTLETMAKEALGDCSTLSAYADTIVSLALDLLKFLNNSVPDRRLWASERYELACQSILVALDDAMKVGKERLAGSTGTEKTKVVLKNIEEAQNFVKTQLPQILRLKTSVVDAAADGRLEIREVAEIVSVAQKISWSSLFSLVGSCCLQKSVAVSEPSPAPRAAPLPKAQASQGVPQPLPQESDPRPSDLESDNEELDQKDL